MKPIESREEKVRSLMKKARMFPEGSVEMGRIVMQILRLYNPEHYSVPDSNFAEVDF